MQCLININIHQLIDYLETFDYDLKKLNILIKFFKNERLAKYFFRDKFILMVLMNFLHY